MCRHPLYFTVLSSIHCFWQTHRQDQMRTTLFVDVISERGNQHLF